MSKQATQHLHMRQYLVYVGTSLTRRRSAGTYQLCRRLNVSDLCDICGHRSVVLPTGEEMLGICTRKQGDVGVASWKQEDQKWANDDMAM